MSVSQSTSCRLLEVSSVSFRIAVKVVKNMIRVAYCQYKTFLDKYKERAYGDIEPITRIAGKSKPISVSKS